MELKKFYFAFFSSLLLLNAEVGYTQIIPDNTLPINSSVNSEGQVQQITNGSQVGSNLFHSFTDFSLSPEITAYFNNNSDVENIISRVTGSSISNISGVIQANGDANFFLINPNGIVFGPNATLNTGGAFTATTASSILFADGTQFSAIKTFSPPLLTINVPVGLSFETPPGEIIVQGNGHSLTRSIDFMPIKGIDTMKGLRVSAGESLALVGGNILLEGGNIISEDGKVALVSIKSGTVNTHNLFTEPNSQSFSNIQLSQKASIVAYGTGSNTIELYGENIKLADGSTIINQNRGSQTDGKLNIEATKAIEIIDSSQISQFRSSIYSENIGDGLGASVTVSGESILLKDGGRINSTNYSNGEGSNLVLTAKNIQVTGVFPNNSTLYSDISSQNVGSEKGGDISIVTDDLLLNNSGGVGTVSFGNGNAGNLTINASQKIQVSGASVFRPTFGSTLSSLSFASGNSGHLLLSTSDLIVEEGGSVGSRTFGFGRGGDVFINANFINITGGLSTIFSPSLLDASTFGAGDAGSLTIETTDLFIQKGARVDTSTLASGNAGNLTVNALNLVEVSDASFLDSSAALLSESFQKLYDLPAAPSGKSGNVVVNTRQLIVRDNSQVSVRNDGINDAGELKINANSIELNNKATINALTQSGNGGNININSQELVLRSSSGISTEAKGSGNGGNINIKSHFIVAPSLENSDITANAFKGRGGSINIEAQGIFGLESRLRLTSLSDITASSALGINGTVEINTLDTQVASTTTLPQEIVETPEITSTCQPNSNTETGTFTLTGTGGIPPNPDDMLSTSSGWQDRSAINQSEDTLKEKLSVVPPQIVEAQGWRKNSDGTIVLTVEPTGEVALTAAVNVGCNQASATKTNTNVKSRDR